MMLNIVHLSDLHIGHPRAQVDKNEVLRPLTSHLSEQADAIGQPDLIVFSGDLVYGQIESAPISDQLSEARSWAMEITNDFAVPFFLVPGNHDVNRTLVDQAHRDWIHALGGGRGRGGVGGSATD